MKKIVAILIISSLILASCSSDDNENVNNYSEQDKNIFSGSIQDQEIPATEDTKTWNFATWIVGSWGISIWTGSESYSSDDSTPPDDVTGVYVQ